MIRAIVQNGVIRPIEPLPPDWQDGREVIVGIAPDLSANGGAPESFVQRASRLDQAGHRDAALDSRMPSGEMSALPCAFAPKWLRAPQLCPPCPWISPSRKRTLRSFSFACGTRADSGDWECKSSMSPHGNPAHDPVRQSRL